MSYLHDSTATRRAQQRLNWTHLSLLATQWGEEMQLFVESMKYYLVCFVLIVCLQYISIACRSLNRITNIIKVVAMLNVLCKVLVPHKPAERTKARKLDRRDHKPQLKPKIVKLKRRDVMMFSNIAKPSLTSLWEKYSLSLLRPVGHGR